MFPRLSGNARLRAKEFQEALPPGWEARVGLRPPRHQGNLETRQASNDDRDSKFFLFAGFYGIKQTAPYVFGNVI